MKRLINFSRNKLLAAGAMLAVVLLTAIVSRQFGQPPGRLPTREELREPFVAPGPGGAHGLQDGIFTEQQMQAIQEGKTVTIIRPGGGFIQIGPPPESTETPNSGSK
jgi:hypothetical protein